MEFLDVKTLDPASVRVYQKHVVTKHNEKKNLRTTTTLIGHISADGNGFHKFHGYNMFEHNASKLPSRKDGWLTGRENYEDKYNFCSDDEESLEDYIANFSYDTSYVTSYICNPTIKFFMPKEPISEKFSNYRMFKTLCSNIVRYVVFVNDDVHVYQITDNIVPWDCDDYDRPDQFDVKYFDRFVATFKPLRVFVGQSRCNGLTHNAGTYGEEWIGNSILLRIGDRSEFRYIFIGACIFEFTLDEKIVKYVSSVDSMCESCPYAESTNHVYDMTTSGIHKLSDKPDRHSKGDVLGDNPVSTFFAKEISSRTVHVTRDHKFGPISCKFPRKQDTCTIF